MSICYVLGPYGISTSCIARGINFSLVAMILFDYEITDTGQASEARADVHCTCLFRQRTFPHDRNSTKKGLSEVDEERLVKDIHVITK